MFLTAPNLSLSGDYLRVDTITSLGTVTESRTIPLKLPAPRLATRWGFPTPENLISLSYSIYAASATFLVAGVVTIGSVANADIDGGVKAGICSVTGFLMLSACYCCKLSNDYWQLSSNIRQYTEPDFIGYRWWDRNVVRVAGYDGIV